MRTNSEVTSVKPLSAHQTHLVISGALLAVAVFAGIACHATITADSAVQSTILTPAETIDIQ